MPRSFNRLSQLSLVLSASSRFFSRKNFSIGRQKPLKTLGIFIINFINAVRAKKALLLLLKAASRASINHASINHRNG